MINTMIDIQGNKQLYGREKESKQLQCIVESILCRGNHYSEGDGDVPTMDHNNNNDDDVGPIFRKSSMNTSDISNDYNNDIHSRTTRNDVSYNSSLVLIHGPRGHGKKTFAYQTLQNMTSCVTNKLCVAKKQQINILDHSTTHHPPFILVSGQYKPGHVVRSKNSNETQAPNAKNMQRMVDERPFAAFDEAIVEIIRIMSTDDRLLNEIRQNLMNIIASPSEIEILTTTFPCMGKWLNDVEAKSMSSISEGNSNSNNVTLVDHSTSGLTTLDFKRTLRGIHLMEQQVQVRCPAMIHFLQAVSNVIPITILLVDVQYADAASISLMESLISIQETNDAIGRKKMKKRLLMVATYHTDNVDVTSDKLLSLLTRCQINCTCTRKCKFCNRMDLEHSQAMKELSKNNYTQHIPTINSMVLSELKWDDLNTWIQANNTFKMYTLEQQKHISDLVYHHCHGNPLCAQYIILYLEHYSSSHEINKMAIPSTLGELYLKILLRQSKTVQDIVKTAAALIHSGFDDDVSFGILDIAMDQLCNDEIFKIEDCKLLQFRHTTRTVKFSHHEFEEAVYNMIPITDRPTFHLNIGRRIWRNAILLQGNVPPANNDNSIQVLLATLQLRNSIILLSDVNERVYMSQLCYETGHKLISVGDYMNAAKIFDFAICVLGTEIWSDTVYEASLALHNAAVQAYCYYGDIDAMEKILDAIFHNARSFHDQVPGYVALIYAQGIRHQLVDVVRTVSVVLKELGEPLNQNPSHFEIMKQMITTQWLLYGKTDTYFLRLPISEDENYMIVTQLLSFAMHYTFVKSPEMCLVICCQMLRSAITIGISGPSVMALSVFGCFLTGSGDFDKGYRIGELAIRLVDRFEAWIPRTYMYFYCYTTHWIHPIRDSIEPLKHAAQIACKFGDLELYGLCLYFQVISMFYSGVSLPILEKICRTRCESNIDLGYNNLSLIFTSTTSFVVKLTGSNVPFKTSDDIKDAESALKYSIKDGNKFYIGRYYLEQTIWYYLTGEYVTALNFIKKAKMINPISEYNLPFFEGLLEFAYTWTCTSYVQRQKHKYRGCKLIKVLKKWSKRCPANFENKYMLLLAEYNALVGRRGMSLQYFTNSIKKATDEGFISEVAIAYERQGRYQLYLNKTIDAKVSLERAKDAYSKWGSKPLCCRIDGVLLTIV